VLIEIGTDVFIRGRNKMLRRKEKKAVCFTDDGRDMNSCCHFTKLSLIENKEKKTNNLSQDDGWDRELLFSSHSAKIVRK
jgi:hypothetical protein